MTLTQPDPLSISGTAGTYGLFNISCNGESDGSIDISVRGGTTAYSYNWSTGATTQDVSGLPAGPYNVVVTDANGCMESYYITLVEPDPLVITITQSDTSCWNMNMNEITITATGGHGSYMYSIDGGSSFQASNVFGSLNRGGYSIVVKDAFCDITGSITLVEHSLPTANAGNDTTFYVGYIPAQCQLLTGVASGGSGSGYSYSWAHGATTDTTTVCYTGAASYTYTLIVTDGNGCKDTDMVSIDTLDVRCSSPTGYVRVCANVAGAGYKTACIPGLALFVDKYFADYGATWGPCPVPKESGFEFLDAVNVYPNPSNGVFNIRPYKAFDGARMVVYDGIGKVVAEKSLFGDLETLDLSAYQAGVYYMMIEIDGQVVSKKLLLH